MKNRLNTTRLILGLIAILSALTVLVFADTDTPYGVRQIDLINSTRANLSTYGPDSIDAAAGNVTEINLTAISTTKAWAGYYGNISGVLTLEDVYGYVFYNWTALEPKGEIYASVNNTITWANVVCYDFANVDSAEAYYGIEADDGDGINETFTDNTNLAFQVGTVQVLVNTCPATNPYRFGQQKVDGDFENVLLTDTVSLIFATIIENNQAANATDKEGFDNRLHDFQLLVAENGQDGQEDIATPYFFWAEIE
jgi:hypothetical protein